MRIELYVPTPLEETTLLHKFIVVLRHYLSSFSGIEITDKNPDIVHIFGDITLKNKQKIIRCYSLKIPVVYTPFSALQPWCISPFTQLSLLTKAISHFLSLNVSAIHVCNVIEKETIRQSVGGKNIVLIFNSLLTSQITDAEMAMKMKDFYAETIKRYDISMQESIAKQVEMLACTDEVINQLCRAILYVHYLYIRKSIPKKVLINLVKMFHCSEYDEEKMQEKLTQLNLMSFTASLEYVLKENFALLEGFMPISAEEGKESEDIKMKITDYTNKT